MTPVSRGRERLRWLAAAFVAALVLRVVVFYSGLVDPMFDTGDSYEYRNLAESLLQHHVFGWDGDPRMNRTPGYPVALAAMYAVVGRSQLAVTSAQVLIDTLTCVMITDIAIRTKMPKIGVVVTTALAASCLFTISHAYQVMTEVVYTFGLVGAVWVLPAGGVTALLHRKNRWRVAVAGLFLGYTTFTRPSHAMAIAAFVGLAALMLVRVLKKRVLDRRVIASTVAAGAILGATSGLVVVPWMARNRIVFAHEYEKPQHDHVTLLGYKTDVPVYRHWYSKQFVAYRFSYEEPFVMEAPYAAPVILRYVYPGEEEDVRAAFAQLTKEVLADQTTPIQQQTLDEFVRIRDKRYAAAPRLRVTAPLSRFLRFWMAPRISVIKSNLHGGMVSTTYNAGLTAYNALYVIPGLLGLALGMRGARPIWLGIMGVLVSQAILYSLFFSPQSRYTVPLFPLLCVGCGVFASELARRILARTATLGSWGRSRAS